MSLVQDVPLATELSEKKYGGGVTVMATRRVIGAHPFEFVNACVKRALDVIISMTLVILAAPLFAVLSLLICLDGGPVIYKHKRLGRGLRPFNCLKFRSMMADDILEEYLSYNPAAAEEWSREQKLSSDPRVTAIGKFIRAASLDELPQLINVLRGEMSLVGPRPITSSETRFYGTLIEHYARLRPGITGLWQVSGRNEVDFASRVALDRCYATVNNVIMDVAILLRTPWAVFSRHGAR